MSVLFTKITKGFKLDFDKGPQDFVKMQEELIFAKYVSTQKYQKPGCIDGLGVDVLIMNHKIRCSHSDWWHLSLVLSLSLSPTPKKKVIKCPKVPQNKY